MFFKNAIVYAFKGKPAEKKVGYKQDEFERHLKQDSFRPCGAQEVSSFGWSPAFGKYGKNLSEFIGSKILICARKEEKILPSSVVNELLQAKIEKIEIEESRRVGYKEKNELKECILTTLLPQAFTKSTYTYAFIDTESGLVVVNASSHNKAEDLLALLRRSLGSLRVVPCFIGAAIEKHLTDWFINTPPEHFTVGNNFKLTDFDGEQVISAKTSCPTQDLQDFIGQQVSDGNFLDMLQLFVGDKLSFTLHSNGQIKSIKWGDVLLEENVDIPKENMVEKLQADFILSSSELVGVINELVKQFIKELDI